MPEKSLNPRDNDDREPVRSFSSLHLLFESLSCPFDVTQSKQNPSEGRAILISNFRFCSLNSREAAKENRKKRGRHTRDRSPVCLVHFCSIALSTYCDSLAGVKACTKVEQQQRKIRSQSSSRIISTRSENRFYREFWLLEVALISFREQCCRVISPSSD